VFFAILMADEGATFFESWYAEMKENATGNPAAHNAPFVSMERLSVRRSVFEANGFSALVPKLIAKSIYPRQWCQSTQDCVRFAPRGLGSGQTWSWQHKRYRSAPLRYHCCHADQQSRSCTPPLRDNIQPRSLIIPRTRATWSGKRRINGIYAILSTCSSQNQL